MPGHRIENWHQVPQKVRDAFNRKKQDELDHFELYGFHRPPLIVGTPGDRIIALGSTLLHWKGKGSFVNFLEECLLFHLGDALEQYEIHPLRVWLDEARRQGRERKKENPKSGLLSTVAVLNFFTVAYDLYVVSDNAQLRDRLIQSLKIPDQFHGARYELMVAACLLRAGFIVEFSDETDLSTAHPDAFVRHIRTGVEYDVEMKAKGRNGILGKPGIAIEPEMMSADVSRLVRKALLKPAVRTRLIFIDMNLPLKSDIRGLHSVWWAEEAIKSLKVVRKSPGKVSSDTEAFVIFTNFPSNFIPFDQAYEGVEIVYCGFNKTDFDLDKRVLGERSPEIANLFDAFRKHSVFPDEVS